jgi:hypothetical protein
MGNNFDFTPETANASKGFWDSFSAGDLIGGAIGPTISGLGSYFLANQANQDKIAAEERNREFLTQQDATNFQQQQEMAKLQAALAEGAGGGMVKAAKIKAQVDREKMLQEAYIAAMQNALQGGQMIGTQLGGVADRIMQMRLG